MLVLYKGGKLLNGWVIINFWGKSLLVIRLVSYFVEGDTVPKSISPVKP